MVHIVTDLVTGTSVTVLLQTHILARSDTARRRRDLVDRTAAFIVKL